jgi:hypothetical protein
MNRPTINQQSADVSTRPRLGSSWSTEADSLCSLELLEDHVEGRQALTCRNPDERGRGDRNNGEGKLREPRRRSRLQNAVRVPYRDPERAGFSVRQKPSVKLRRRCQCSCGWVRSPWAVECWRSKRAWLRRRLVRHWEEIESRDVHFRRRWPGGSGRPSALPRGGATQTFRVQAPVRRLGVATNAVIR